MKTKSTNIIMKNKDITTVFVVTAAILSLPLVAMQFSSEWEWSLFDFIIMGTLIMGTGLLMVFAARKIKNYKKRVAVIMALLAALIILWVHLAVGIVDALPFSGS